MGSPVSPSVANAKMEDFEVKALESASTCNPLHIWYWYMYVDDTFTILHQYVIEAFTNHINSLDPHIEFTIEEEQDDQLPFLNTCIIVNKDDSENQDLL